MKKVILSATALAMLGLVACGDSTDSKTTTPADTTKQNPTPADNSKTSVDWAGVYQGTLPCADCEGILSTITLSNNDSFVYTNVYIGKNDTIVDAGKIMWHDNGGVVHLKGATADVQLKVGENKLIQLDQEGKVIEGALADKYIYTKK